MLRYTRIGLVVVAAVLVLRGVGVRTQSASAPILVVINTSSSDPNPNPNRFGIYLSEILKAEGLNSHTVVELSTVTSTTLDNASVVVLAETPLLPAQATLFSNFAAAGGRLIVMNPAPDSPLLPVLGLTSQSSTTSEGYFAINVANAFADGFPTTTLPFHGVAQNHTPAPGTQVLATLYSDATTPTPYPAVVKSGTTITWTYDLVRSVVFTRQGNPANARERDGAPPYRTEDIFYNAIDKDKVPIPYADVQMRMLARAITELMATVMPLPRTWYFPGSNKTVLVLTGDSHANPQSYFDTEIAAIESHGGRMSIYAYGGTAPDLTSVNTWKSSGHEVGMHPAAYQFSGRTLGAAFQANLDWFRGLSPLDDPNPIRPSATARIHQFEWQGWVDAANVAASSGVKMDTSFSTWGPAITYPDHQAHGYITGSGQPMRFIDEAGAIVPVYQQVTSLIDDALVTTDSYSEHLTPDQALVVSRQLIDNSQAGDYAAITTLFHVDYFQFGEVNPWALGTMDYANSLGIPMWTAEHWLKFTEDRNATTMSGYSWSAQSRQLQFSVTVPAGSEALTLALPGTFAGFNVTSVTLDGSTATTSSQTITGRPTIFLFVPAGIHTIGVTYNTPVPPPEHSPIAVNDSAAVNEGQSVKISVLANDTDADGDPLAVTSAGPDSGADIVINPDQTITYTPHALTCGIDAFPYSISDGRGGTASATVSVTVTCLTGQVMQKTFADFSPSCAVPTNAIVTRVGDGEVRLAGVQGDEYTRSTLDTTLWTAGIYGGGAYTPTIANSVMSLSNSAGAFVRSATTLPITTLESSVNFTAQPWEHVGWGSLDFGGAYAIFSTFNQSANLYARTSADGINEQQANLGALRTGFHTYRIDRQAASDAVDTISYYIDGVLAAQHSVPTLPAMYVYQSNSGGTSHTLDVDRIWVYPNYSTSGSYQSCTQDIGQTLSTWTTATWSATVPTGTTLQMRTRTSTNASSWSNWSDPITSSGGDVTSPAGRYLQYLLEFTSADPAASAVVDSVTVSFAESSPPALTIDDVSKTEGDTGQVNASFTVSLSASSTKTVTVDYSVADGSATAPGDYSPAAATGTVTFNPGETSHSIPFVVNGDRLFEADETFFVNLTNPTNATITKGQGVGTINNDDAAPTLSINDVRLAEGNTGSQIMTFTITQSAASGLATTVNYATADGTAKAGNDYTAASGTATIAVGALTQTVTVPILGDTVVEQNETLLVNLTDQVNATIAKAQGVGTILNDETTISIADVSVTEGNSGTKQANFAVTLAAPTTQTVTVNYATANGTAVSSSDYVTKSGTLTFPAGSTSATVTVLVNGDTLNEANETFVVNLSAPVGATIADGQGVGTITDDDPLPALSIADASLNEGKTGTANMNFTVTLSPASGQTVTVSYGTSNGTAAAGTDYSARTGTLTFAAGVKTQTIAVPITGNTIPQADRTFVVTLSTPTSTPMNATISRTQATGTIRDDDGTIKVTSPTTKSTWRIGSVGTISWTNNLGPAATVRLEISWDGASTWSLIDAAAPNTSATGGSYAWTVTGPATTKARIRATWTTNPSVTATNAGNFVIQ